MSVKAMSESEGCVAVGTPLVEIVLIHLLVTAAMDWMPPSVEDEGFGKNAPVSAVHVGATIPLMAVTTVFEQVVAVPVLVAATAATSVVVPADPNTDVRLVVLFADRK